MKFWLVLFCTLLTCSAFAINDGSDVVVVYNSTMAESKDVADHYASMRSVPSSQIVGLALPRTEVITRAQYREQLQDPLLKFLEKQNLFLFKDSKLAESKVRYLVLCFGVPLTIASDPSISEKVDQLKPELRKNGAAVDSELSTLPSIHQKLPFAGPLANPLFRLTNSAAMNPTNGVIMVARLDGPTAEIARSLVDKSVQAERDGLWGRAYIDMRGLTNSEFEAADTNFLVAAAACERAGFETVVDKKVATFSRSFPMSQIAIYAGWYDENVSGPFTRPHVEFMPGAFAYHLHSFSAQTLHSSDTHWAGPLLAKGAAATMGAVDEPLLGGLPDMGIFFTRWLLLGMTYGEAAYSSLEPVSWQTTVVGDPLYRPFRKPGQKLHEELVARGSKLVAWSHLRVIDINLALGSKVSELVQYLKEIPDTKTSAVLTEKLGDLYEAQGKPESMLHEYREALKLDPSPQQEVRLRLNVINKLLALGKQHDAEVELDEFHKRCRDYPDMDALDQRVRNGAHAGDK